MIGVKIYSKAEPNIKKTLAVPINDKLESIKNQFSSNKGAVDLINLLNSSGKNVYCWAGVRKFSEYLSINSRCLFISESLGQVYLCQLAGKLEDNEEHVKRVVKWIYDGWKKVLFFYDVISITISETQFTKFKEICNARRGAPNQGYFQDKYLFEGLDEKEVFNILQLKELSSKEITIQDKHLSLDLYKNIIFYGPPGTGKTFITKRKAIDIINSKR